MYYIKFREDPFDLQGSRSYTRGNYDYYEEYEVTAKIHDQGLYGVPYDASRNFDDSIAEEIAPFHREDLVDYRSGYLAGMYADCPNVGADVYEKDVKKKATDTAIADINKDFRGIPFGFHFIRFWQAVLPVALFDYVMDVFVEYTLLNLVL